MAVTGGEIVILSKYKGNRKFKFNGSYRGRKLKAIQSVDPVFLSVGDDCVIYAEVTGYSEDHSVLKVKVKKSRQLWRS